MTVESIMLEMLAYRIGYWEIAPVLQNDFDVVGWRARCETDNIRPSARQMFEAIDKSPLLAVQKVAELAKSKLEKSATPT